MGDHTLREPAVTALGSIYDDPISNPIAFIPIVDDDGLEYVPPRPDDWCENRRPIAELTDHDYRE